MAVLFEPTTGLSRKRNYRIKNRENTWEIKRLSGSQPLITYNVWLKLVICCLRSKYKLRAKVRWPKPRTLAVHRVRPNQNFGQANGSKCGGQGWTLSFSYCVSFTLHKEIYLPAENLDKLQFSIKNCTKSLSSLGRNTVHFCFVELLFFKYLISKTL
jgi:hypothetical protein